MLHEMGSLVLPARTNITSGVIPSTNYLDRVDSTRSMSVDELREVIRASRHRFEDTMANTIQFESDHPEMTIEEVIDLYEPFYLLEPVEEKWGVGGDRGSACVRISCLQHSAVTACSWPCSMT
jgi:hypothetical protein